MEPGVDPNVSASFQFISNLKTISTVCDMLFHTSTITYCYLTAAFNPLQSAYHQHRLTKTSLSLSLIHLLNFIHHAADNWLDTLLLSCNLCAAFDNIDHVILCNRLISSFGITSGFFSQLAQVLSLKHIIFSYFWPHFLFHLTCGLWFPGGYVLVRNLRLNKLLQVCPRAVSINSKYADDFPFSSPGIFV